MAPLAPNGASGITLFLEELNMSEFKNTYQCEHKTPEHAFILLRDVWAISTQRKMRFGVWLNIVTHGLIDAFADSIGNDKYVEDELRLFIINHCSVMTLPRQAILLTYNANPAARLSLNDMPTTFQMSISPLDYTVWIRCKQMDTKQGGQKLWTPWKESAIPKSLLA